MAPPAKPLTAFETSLPANGDAPQDLSPFAPFPYGVAGITSQNQDTSLPSLSSFSVAPFVAGNTEDQFAPYQTQLVDFLNLLNQIATLCNRTSSIGDMLSPTTNPNTSFNPQSTLDLVAIMSGLNMVYCGDQATLQGWLGTCLNGPGPLGADCEPIINNAISDAYTWYGPTGPNPHPWSTAQLWMAQQNTVALQYTVNNLNTRADGNGKPCPMVNVPMAAVYVAPLGPFLPRLAGSASHRRRRLGVLCRSDVVDARQTVQAVSLDAVVGDDLADSGHGLGRPTECDVQPVQHHRYEPGAAGVGDHQRQLVLRELPHHELDPIANLRFTFDRRRLRFRLSEPSSAKTGDR